LVLAAHASQDLTAASDGADLDMTVLRRWSEPRVNAVLRSWLAREGLRSPETRHMQQMWQMLWLRADAQPALKLPQFTVRAHAGRLICQTHRTAEQQPPGEQPWSWRRGALALPDGSELSVLPDPHGDLDLASLPAKLQVRFAGRAALDGRRLRKLLQELQVPQWERARLPLLGAAQGGFDHLLAVGDLWLHESIRSHANTSRRGRIVWQMRV
jgi:tRNA(Ile)-lysidine synthase